jgi:hypothetical protein
MKSLLSIILFVFVTTTTTAQKFDLKINVAANLTLMPDFQNRIYIVDGFTMPGAIGVEFARNPPGIATTTSKTNPGAGFTVEAEAGMKLNDKWKLSLALGLMQLRYDYDTHISQSFYKNDFYLGDVYAEYGKTKFTYLSLRPANVTRMFNRLSIQAGPVLSYLLSKEHTNTVVVYNTSTKEAVGGFFEEKGDAQKFLFGAHINARYAVIRNLEVMVGAQYFLNSLYKSEGTYEQLHDKAKALQLQLGLSYNFASLLCKAK